MIMQKTTITHKNRNAKTVDEFYYAGMEEQLAGQQGTGVRLLAGDFIRQGKVLDRFLVYAFDEVIKFNRIKEQLFIGLVDVII